MVSVYPIPPQEQGYFNSFKYLSGDTMKVNKKFDENNSDYMVFGSGLEDPSRKVRKPYTITKFRESWSEQEHDKFLEALQLFDRDWKKIEAFIGSKTVIQIRSHAQKYFMKVQKNGTSEHVPPPRPKRKAAHPYPQKAPKIVVSGAGQPLQSSAALLDSGYVARPESLPISRNPLGNASLPTWNYNAVPAASTSDIPKDHTGFTLTHNYSSSSNESTPRVWPYNEANPLVKEKENKPTTTRVMPDFAQVYSFIGSVFDPNKSDHLQRLKKMDPIDIETILMMMKNLSFNLASPEFDAHRKLLSSHNIGLEKEKARSTISSA